MPIQRIQAKNRQQSWGKQKRSNEFRLYALPLFLPVNPLDLTGHQLIDISYNDEKGTELTDYRWQQGVLHMTQGVTPNVILNMSGTLKYPHAIWTFIDGVLEYSQQGACFAFLRVPECNDPCERFFTYYEVLMDQARELSVFVGFSDNKQVIDRESDILIIYAYRQWIFNKFAKVDDFLPLYGATFMVSGCPGCVCDPLMTVYAVGNDESTEPTFYKSSDGLGELTEYVSLNNIIANTDNPSGIWANSHLILIPYANTTNPLTGTTGGILFSYDSIIFDKAVDEFEAELTDPIYWIVYTNGRWIAGGGNGTLLTSMNGRVWRTIPHLFPNSVFVDADYDPKQVILRIAGFTGANGLALEVDGRNLITDISADVNPAGRLYSVRCLGSDHFIFGGEYGFLTETFKATQKLYNSSSFGSVITDVIRTIAGDNVLLYFAMNNQLFQRHIFTNMEVTSLDTGLTINGNIQDIAWVRHPMRGNIKRLRAVTDQGEVISFEDCVPDICTFIQARHEAIAECGCLC